MAGNAGAIGRHGYGYAFAFPNAEAGFMVGLANAGHTCSFCNRTFSSMQALGGHQTAHRREIEEVRRQYNASIEESSANQVCLADPNSDCSKEGQEALSAPFPFPHAPPVPAPVADDLLLELTLWPHSSDDAEMDPPATALVAAPTADDLFLKLSMWSHSSSDDDELDLTLKL